MLKIIKENDEQKILKCPACSSGEIIIDKNSKYLYGYCDTCGAAYIDYEPLPHQLDVHKSKARFKLLMGGMGSAKSRAGVIEIIDHAITVRNGRTIIMAQTLKQLSEAIMPIFNEYLPRKLVTKWTDTKADISIDLKNGHRIIGVASDDEEKLRSMDITAFLIEEASGIKRSLYEECIRRLRNKAAVINGVPHYLGIIISNPAQGFIRDLLFESSKISGSKSISKTVEHYKDRIQNPNPNLEAFLSSSRDNPHLPEGFVESVINSLTPIQVRMYVDCLIEYAEGAVYPDFLQHVCDDFEIPKHWKRWMAHDPGINDPAAVLVMAENPETKEYFAYREYYKTDQVITQVAHAIKTMTSDIPQGMLNMPLIDPSANKRNKVNGRTYKQQMLIEHDLVFKDANNRIIDGCWKVRDMFYNNKLWIFRSLTNTIREGCEYRYPTLEERAKNRNLGDTPLDKNNHLMDCLRYICQDVPYEYLDPLKASYSGVKKFFEKMGYSVKNNSKHSNPKTFGCFAQEVAQSLVYKQTFKNPKKASGGFKL